MPKRIILNEHILTDRRYFSMLIRTCGYEVITVESAEDALALARREKPDFTQLSFQQVGLSSIDVIGLINGDPELKSTPVLLVTSEHSTKPEDHGVSADDVVALLQKPVSVKAYTDLLTATLG